MNVQTLVRQKIPTHEIPFSKISAKVDYSLFSSRISIPGERRRRIWTISSISGALVGASAIALGILLPTRPSPYSQENGYFAIGSGQTEYAGPKLETQLPYYPSDRSFGKQKVDHVQIGTLYFGLLALTGDNHYVRDTSTDYSVSTLTMRELTNSATLKIDQDNTVLYRVNYQKIWDDPEMKIQIIQKSGVYEGGYYHYQKQVTPILDFTSFAQGRSAFHLSFSLDGLEKERGYFWERTGYAYRQGDEVELSGNSRAFTSQTPSEEYTAVTTAIKGILKKKDGVMMFYTDESYSFTYSYTTDNKADHVGYHDLTNAKILPEKYASLSSLEEGWLARANIVKTIVKNTTKIDHRVGEVSLLEISFS